MSTLSRSIVPASIGPALTVVTAASALLNGPMATLTTIAFVLTVVWGIIEIAFLSYTPIASIELDGPSLLEDGVVRGTAEVSEENSAAVVPFPDPNPQHVPRAA